MSHFTRLKTKIVELLYLKRALKDLNLQFEEGRSRFEGTWGVKPAWISAYEHRRAMTSAS
jgi:hypothetical protein